MQNYYPTLRNCLLALGFLAMGCNVFNPSGSGDVDSSSDGQITQGEKLFRNKDYAGSMAAYEKAIAHDSSSSLAYYGYAKAAMRYYQLNASIILGEVSDAQADKTIPFLNSSDEKLTKYLQATSKVRKALSLMTTRDTLSRWYDYSLNPKSKAALKDAFAAKRIAFIKDYLLKADQKMPGYFSKDHFPLIDGALPYEKVVVDYGFIELLYALVHLRDLDQNDTIDSRDNLIKKLNFKLDGGLKVENLDSIKEELSNPETKANLNNLIQNVSSGLSSAGSVLNLLTPLAGNQAGSDSLSNQKLSDQATQNVDSVINTLGDAVTFYQFGDGKDNDGDGCIDEEILDGKDNDGDGFIDEDSRIALADGVDNDHNGTKDLLDPGELIDGTFNLVFTTDGTFKKGPDYKDRAVRVAIQKDSLATKTTLTSGQKILLDSAKAKIGGCWNNY